jgi:hypothetical protein
MPEHSWNDLSCHLCIQARERFDRNSVCCTPPGWLFAVAMLAVVSVLYAGLVRWKIRLSRGLTGHRYRDRACRWAGFARPTTLNLPGSSSLPAAVEAATIHAVGPTQPSSGAVLDPPDADVFTTTVRHGPRGYSMRTSRLATHTWSGLSSANKSLNHLHGLTTVLHLTPAPSVVASMTFPRTRSARSPNPACGNGSPRPTNPTTTIHPTPATQRTGEQRSPS